VTEVEDAGGRVRQDQTGCRDGEHAAGGQADNRELEELVGALGPGVDEGDERQRDEGDRREALPAVEVADGRQR
jgi:hypothetical protein